MTYADITIRDRNPIKRWIHRRRYFDALTAIKDCRLPDRIRIVDFGAGNGELVRLMTRIAPVEAWIYEPTPSLMAEARENLSGLDGVAFVDSLASVESAVFDYVFCLEVFEHLPDEETIHAIMEIHRLLKPDGVAVIGVPHEVFLPALLKGIFRMCRRYGEFDASPTNIVAAVLGHPPTPRPTSELSAGIGYHFQHLGFDFRILEQQLRKHFEVSKKWFSPFPPFGALLNSEVYFLLRKFQPGALGYAPQATRS